MKTNRYARVWNFGRFRSRSENIFKKSEKPICINLNVYGDIQTVRIYTNSHFSKHAKEI